MAMFGTLLGILGGGVAGLASSAQYVSGQIASGDTTATITITSVSTANSIIVFNGMSGLTDRQEFDCTHWVLTNSTTITLTRGLAGGSTGPTVYLIVYEFLPGLITQQQMTTVTGTAGGSGTGVITSSSTSKSIILPYGAINSTNTSASSIKSSVFLAHRWALNSTTQTQCTFGSEWPAGTITAKANVVQTA